MTQLLISATWLENRQIMMQAHYQQLESQLPAVAPEVRKDYEAMLLRLSSAEEHLEKVIEHYRRIVEGKLL